MAIIKGNWIKTEEAPVENHKSIFTVCSYEAPLIHSYKKIRAEMGKETLYYEWLNMTIFAVYSTVGL